jgi:2-polyprenyl-3-methyl-5-hydroxy-6-metoxy-1,4-benzoquinol methylase
MSEACLLCHEEVVAHKEALFDTRFGIPGNFSVGQCIRCGFEQLLGIPSFPKLKSLYETYYNFGGEGGTWYAHLREVFLSSWVYRAWLCIDGDISFHASRGNGRLLDFGCNEGRGLGIYEKNGFLTEGLELNEKAAAVARSAGFTVHTCELAEVDASHRYNVIVLSNVLEHAIDPLQLLSCLNDHLEPGGQLWISCPNSHSWLRSVFRQYWINWHVPFHVSHFSLDSLTSALAKTGFRVYASKQLTPAAWAASSFVARFFAKNGKPTKALRNPVLFPLLVILARTVLSPVLWFGNSLGRGDCLRVIAVKSCF